jgi:hypothetical protein
MYELDVLWKKLFQSMAVNGVRVTTTNLHELPVWLIGGKFCDSPKNLSRSNRIAEVGELTHAEF